MSQQRYQEPVFGDIILTKRKFTEIEFDLILKIKFHRLTKTF